MKSSSLIVTAVVGLLGILAGWSVCRFALIPGLGAPSENAEPGIDGGASLEDDGKRNVAALGRVEPAGGMISLSAMVGDRVASLQIAEGQVVELNPGDQRTIDAEGRIEIGRMDGYELRALELKSIESRLSEAKAREKAETNLADARIAAAKLALEQAQSYELELEAQEKQLEVLRRSLALETDKFVKIENLPEEIVSMQEKDQQRLLVQKLSAEVAAGEVGLKRIEQTGKFAIDAAQADLDAAQVSKEQIKASIPTASLNATLEAAQAQLDRMVLRAPIGFTVMKIYTRPGEHVTNLPVLQMADLRRMVCVAEVYETDVRRVRVGQTSIITSKVFDPEVNRAGLRGTVTSVGKMISAAELKPLDPFARADRHVVAVRIEFDQMSAAIAARLVNLQVDVKIETDQSSNRVAGWPLKKSS